MTAAPAPDPLPASSNVPDIAHRPDYRDRVRSRYTTAAGQRIEKARAAAAELGQTDPVPWEDIRAVYVRPERTPWESYKASAKEATQYALTVALTIGMVGIFLVALVMGNMKQQAADEARKTALAGTTPVVKEITTSKEEARIVAVCGIFLILVFVKSAHGRVSTRRKLLAEGYLRDGEQVVTEALDALPALAELVSAPVGRRRAEALTDVHAKISAVMTAVTASTETAAGITGYAGDRPRLKEHGQKVRRAFADRLGGLVEDREGTARQLARMVLTVAGRHAQASYGTLLDAGDLPAEPGPELADLRGVRKLLGGAAVAALVVLGVAMFSGADLAASVGLSLGVFVVAAFIGAVFTGRLHEVARAFSLFNRDGGGPAGGAV
ncbi:hypothetical protein QC334_35020 [Streptomyces sp. DH18]|uniref:hypothetical protein n=1 Tax=unclassified Streptomyces TaxID=2593676 RepID=UPI001E4B1AC9|nr:MULTISPECIES: hypothetical protein [unclassified Streptomyces]MDG9687882.1 hypothetical protein [Streptomyces sp. DH18]